MAIEREDWRLLYDVPKDRRPWPYHRWSNPDLSWRMACWGWGHPRVTVGLAIGWPAAFGAFVLATFPRSLAFSALVVVSLAAIAGVNVWTSEVGIGRLAKRWAARGSNPAP